MLAAGAAVLPAVSCTTQSALKGEIPERYNAQLLVVGGGPAGVCAAIAAARLGTQVLLVEEGGFLGGMATRGLVAPFMTCFDARGEKQVIRGIFGEIVDRMVALGGAIHPREVRAGSEFSAWITAGHDHLTPFDAEVLKYVLDTMVREAGVKVLFHASFVAPLMKGKKIVGAVLKTLSGLESVRAGLVVDATGDGHVAAAAGAPFEMGNKETGKIQPATLFCHIDHVDSKALRADVEAHLHEFHRKDGVSYRALHWHVAKAEAAGEWDIARKSVNIYRGVHEDEWAVNSTRIANVDATSSESMTDGEVEGRRQVQELMNFFRKYVPGCKDVRLRASASVLGIRESRHILGEYLLKAEELIAGEVPEDSILLASNSVDVHGGGSGANSTRYTTINADWYGVPYRSLVPLEIEGLLVAGRCLSATSDAAGAVRVMPPAMATGQAAGVAAALCLRGNVAPRRLDSADLRAELLRQGVFLG